MTRTTFVSANSPAQAEYASYLRTWRWRIIRWLRLRIDGHRCRLCHATERLHVHHASYSNRGGSWLGELMDTITVCSSCHGEVHDA